MRTAGGLIGRQSRPNTVSVLARRRDRLRRGATRTRGGGARGGGETNRRDGRLEANIGNDFGDGRLARGAQRAIGRGLDYLERTVDAGGGWPSQVYANPELRGPAAEEQVPFVAALGAISLAACRDERAERLRRRARGFLADAMEAPGVWRYWPALPPDLDDTAVCSLVVGPHVWLALGRTLPVVLAQRDPAGRFRTWMLPRGPDASAGWDDVDSVVNANVVAWLGDGPQTRGAQRWLETLLKERREAGSSWYYPDPMDLYAALARASAGADPAFRDMRPVLAARILERREAGGRFGGAQSTAQALTALQRLGARPGPGAVAAAVDYLIATQRQDGSWPAGVVWRGPPPPEAPSAWFVSAALTAACCIEALQRSTDGRVPSSEP